MSGLGQVDILEMVARHSGVSREQFIRDFDWFMNGPDESNTYVFKGPDWMALCRIVTHADVEEDEAWPVTCDRAWLIYYYFDRQNRGYSKLFKCIDAGLGPKLDWVAFSRPLKGRKKLQFFRWERIRRLCDAPSLLGSRS